MDYWEKLNETLLSEKEDFYSHLNMGDITDDDYAHAKKINKDSEIKKFMFSIYALYVQNNNYC